jgi:hypothetical protein
MRKKAFSLTTVSLSISGKFISAPPLINLFNSFYLALRMPVKEKMLLAPWRKTYTILTFNRNSPGEQTLKSTFPSQFSSYGV